MNERTLTEGIKRAILRAYPDAWVFKVAGSAGQMIGVPDVILCVQGHLVALEVKHQRPGESEAHARARASRQQLKQLQDIERAGGAAAVVLSADEALAVIEKSLT